MSFDTKTAADPEQHYDVIVVGSGMGSLSTASILAQVGKKRVLVLDSHFKIGGFLHSFRRKGYQWEPGVHYIGEMAEGSLTRSCMDLVTGSHVSWHKLDHDFERLIFPEETISIPSDFDEYKARLKQRFPAEAEGLDRYVKDVKKIQSWSGRWFYSKTFQGPLAKLVSAGGKLAKMTTQEYLDKNFTDPILKATLAGQWGDYGAPPSESAFGIHCIVVADFANGGYYPIGGSGKIVDGAVAAIERNGGLCLAKHKVEEILINEKNTAYGVRVETRDGTKEFFAPQIVSGAGIDNTFTRMVPEQHGQAERRRLSRSELGPSAAVLYMGLNDDPRNHGFEDCNYWIYENLGHSKANRSNGEFPPPIDGAYLSFGSIRNPVQETHTAQIVTFSHHADWHEYEDAPWKKRGEGYEAMKASYSDALLDLVERNLPGVRDLVDYRELSTPLTVESFTGHLDGQIYGRACSPERVADAWSIGTSVKQLYLTGTDIVGPGVNSAMMIGVMTAGKLLGVTGMPRVIHAARSATPASPKVSQTASSGR